MKKIAVLGITGSIGRSTREVVINHPDQFEIVLASSHSNRQELVNCAIQFGIKYLVLTSEIESKQTEDVPAAGKLYFGEETLQQLLEDLDIDIVVNAIAGSAGLMSTMTCLRAGKNLALANKESLVMAGHLIQQEVAAQKSLLLPVDSEHSALFQAIGNSSPEEVKTLILTASGGPFRDLPLADFHSITLESALAHPTWSMGRKITIDSATMMNKALEIIEAHWLFNKPFEAIETVIHPQSVIHSLVEFADGSMLAQMSVPNMQLPILYALSYPRHIPSDICQTRLTDLPALTFSPVSKQRYPLFYLALEAGKKGGIMPVIVNAANEAAVNLFLEGRVSFGQITEIVEETLASAQQTLDPDLDLIINTDQEMQKNILSRYGC